MAKRAKKETPKIADYPPNPSPGGKVVTRLADRILNGCEILHPSLMEDVSPNLPAASLDKSEWDKYLHWYYKEKAHGPKLKEGIFEQLPIFVADEVGIYRFSLPEGTYFGDVVASMAPPFDRFFVEFQKIPNEFNLNAWGCLITSTSDPKGIESLAQDYYSLISSNPKVDEDKPRWILTINTFLELQKGKPFGPVAQHYVGLAEDGTWFRHLDGHLWWHGGMPFDPEPPASIHQAWTDLIASLIISALLTISFLHCKNVVTQEIIPPEKLSKKHLKKHGHDLVRYHVLDIKPLRQLLDRNRTGSIGDLRRALHICRGHFKTFTPDAPLWGRHVGTYWWAPQVRGSKSAGVVLKDYRVNAPSEFGRVYREVDENPPEASKEAPPSKDPDSAGRGLAAHNRTQNQIAEIVRRLGWLPLSPTSNEPEFDIAWKVKDNLFVCEVKSLSPTSEERQLRIAVGQVIRYRQKLNAAGYEPVMAVIATEMAPEDQSWNELCIQENIVLVWPEVAEQKFIAAAERIETI